MSWTRNVWKIFHQFSYSALRNKLHYTYYKVKIRVNSLESHDWWGALRTIIRIVRKWCVIVKSYPTPYNEPVQLQNWPKSGTSLALTLILLLHYDLLRRERWSWHSLNDSVLLWLVVLASTQDKLTRAGGPWLCMWIWLCIVSVMYLSA